MDSSLRAGVTQLVECDLAKVDVAGSNPVSRSINLLKRTLPDREVLPPLRQSKRESMQAQFLIVAAILPMVCVAEVCNPRDFHGVYGFQLNGTTTISAQAQPVVSVGRLDFDGTGGVTGVISLSFTGLYLGNPAMGMYEAHEDCSISWDLQDVSGNHQHFQGTLNAEARSARFRQADPGSPSQGTLRKTADACEDRDFQPRYRFTISGSRIDVKTAQVSGSFSARGSMVRQGTQVALTLDGNAEVPGTGAVQVDGDCFVHLDLVLPAGAGDTQEINFRGI